MVRLALLLTLSLGVICCGRETELPSGNRPEAVLTHCGGCHLVPDPSELPRSVWREVVLPRMGAFLGRRRAGASFTKTAEDVLPTGGPVTEAEWSAIVRWYEEQAPDTILAAGPVTGPEIDFLAPRFPDIYLSPPATTYVGFPGPGRIWTADFNKETLLEFGGELEPLRQVRVGAGVTDAESYAGVSYLTIIGSFTPTDEAVGRVVMLGPAGPVTLAVGLRRPTSLLVRNLDDDPEPEIVVTEFGKWAGRLSLLDRDAGGDYVRTTIAERTGATEVVDLGADGFAVLYAQGREEVVRYRPLGKNRFGAETLLRFPPSYGSSALSVTDWNGDGRPDLLHTAGDNADYRPFPKPYHGIRIFTGRTDGSFEEALFLPLPGAYGARVADFDGDGQVEIAAISFFPDYTSGEPHSIGLFRSGAEGWTFHPLAGSGTHRFIRLEVGDVNGDGQPELLAGCLAFEPVPDDGRMAEWTRVGLPWMIWSFHSPK